jgi:Sulfotransferase family
LSRGYPITLTLDQLLAAARAETGIDIIDDDVVEPLRVMLASFNGESRLHEKGAAATGKKLIRLLSNRLRMMRDFRAHPEIDEQIIRPPLIIMGMGRTGSTKTQKLLAASGDFNWMPYWQSHNPCLFSGSRDESPQPRIDEAEEYARWFDAESPENKYGHAIETFEPDEESYALEQCFRTACFIGWCELPGYLAWLARQDPTLQFRFLRDLLKYLQWQGLHTQDKPWVLKCPLYFGLEPHLLSVFPDACLVMTHRHPRETIPSSCRLLETFHMPWTDAPISYSGFFEGSAAQMARHLDIRASHPEIHYLDLAFHDIMYAVPTVMKRIYAHYGMALSDASLARMVAWHERNPKNARGVHKYSLADFAFTEAMIDTAFADYIRLIDRVAAQQKSSDAA